MTRYALPSIKQPQKEEPLMNDVKLLGRLARDPELRYTTNGTAVASFDLAVSRPAGEGQKATDFFPIVAWRNRAEFAANYLTKGRQIVVDGSLRTRKWQDKDGNNRKAIEVVADNIYFADSNKGDGQGAHASSSAPSVPDGFEEVQDSDDDLPF